MSYSVDWAPNALSILAAIWVSSPDRGAVNRAQTRIDRLLAADPLGNGTNVSEGLYAIEVYPLRVLFEVSEVDQFVRVVFVRELP